jgi:hypothetical protein
VAYKLLKIFLTILEARKLRTKALAYLYQVTAKFLVHRWLLPAMVEEARALSVVPNLNHLLKVPPLNTIILGKD